MVVAFPLLVLPLLVLQVGLAAGELFACFALPELLALAVCVAVVVAIDAVVDDVGGVSELDADCELGGLRRG